MNIIRDKNIYKFSITDYKKSIEIGKWLYKDFKYPFGHPKKASSWIKRLNEIYPIAEYKDNKFIIIEPIWLKNSTPDLIFEFIRALDNSEDAYTSLRLNGWSPQQARSVLPNSLKTEINVKMNLREWRHFFKLRCSKAAHPQMRELAIPLLENIKKQLPIIFDDITY